MKIKRTKPANSKINPILYKIFLRLKDTLDAEIVHRRRRKSTTCIEVIFHSEYHEFLNGRINTLPEAEKWGFWIICRAQTCRGHEYWHNKRVFQLFLTPVHPKKRIEARHQAQQAAGEVSFAPVTTRPHILSKLPHQKKSPKYLHRSKILSDFLVPRTPFVRPK